MAQREIKVERLTDLTQDEFGPFGQIMGLEDAHPLEDFAHLSFWTHNYDLGDPGEKLDGGLLLCKRARTVVTKMERHPGTAEIFVPMTGQTVFVMAPAANGDPAPDLSRVRAFLLEGDLGVALHRGTWHWPPLPLGQRARFVLIRKGQLTDPTEMHELGLDLALLF
jgi:ureidoglycolate lyase